MGSNTIKWTRDYIPGSVLNFHASLPWLFGSTCHSNLMYRNTLLRESMATNKQTNKQINSITSSGKGKLKIGPYKKSVSNYLLTNPTLLPSLSSCRPCGATIEIGQMECKMVPRGVTCQNDISHLSLKLQRAMQ